MKAYSDTELLQIKTSNLLESHKERPEAFYTIRNEWVDFLFQNKRLNKLLIEVIMKKKIDKLWLKKVYSYYIIRQILRYQDAHKTKDIDMEKILIPDFICTETETEVEYLYIRNKDNISNITDAFKQEQYQSLPIEAKFQLFAENIEEEIKSKDEVDMLCGIIAECMNKQLIKQELFNIKKLTNDISFEEKLLSMESSSFERKTIEPKFAAVKPFLATEKDKGYFLAV